MNQLNLSEFRVLEVQENEQGDLKFIVEAVEPRAICPECYDTNFYKHGTTERFVRDLNMFNQRVGIVVKGNRYKCRECGKTFTERYYSFDDRDKITNRLREHIKKASLKEPFASIANEFALSPPTVKRIFNEYVAEQEDTMTFYTPRILGIDEVHLNKHMRAVFTNIEKQTILDILTNRNKLMIIKFLKKLPDRQKVEIVTMDMWQQYKDAVSETLPNARIVIDKFHVVQYANKALESVRKSFRKSLPDAQRKLLMHERFVLLKNKEDLNVHELLSRDGWFSTFSVLRTAYYLKEGLRDMYNCESKQQAIEYYEHWKNSIPLDMTAFHDVVGIIENWKTEIFNYFDYFVTNAFTESVNNLIKHIEKRGRGYSFEVLRAKVLFGTKATQRPKYKQDGNFTRLGKVMESLNNYWDLPSPELEEGFGVSIPQLLKVMERDEF